MKLIYHIFINHSHMIAILYHIDGVSCSIFFVLNFPLLYFFHLWFRSSEDVFHHRSSSIKARLPTKVVFHERLSSMKGHLISKFVFPQMTPSIKGYLPSKVVFHERLSSMKGCLLSKVVCHQKSFSIKSRLPGVHQVELT